MDVSSGEALARRQGRLRDELLDEARIGTLSAVALDELSYADRPPVHEGRLPPYGSIVVPESQRETLDTLTAVLSFERLASAATADELRPYADGYSTFVFRCGDDGPWLAATGGIGYFENQVVSLAQWVQGLVVRRSAGGQVSLVMPERVAWRVGGGWTWKPTARVYLPALADHVPKTPVVLAVAEQLLDLCVHTISPLGKGATIVWPLEAEDPKLLENLDFDHVVEPIALGVGDSSHHSAIASAASQLDRAILVDHEGRLSALGVTLQASAGTYEPTLHGTRHASAAAFSAGHSAVLVFVVSSDGPVTVYMGGREIASTLLSRRLVVAEETCDCVDQQLGGDEPFEERWNAAPELADPDCNRCGGSGYWRSTTVVDERLDDVL